jgi:hypothetical protein
VLASSNREQACAPCDACALATDEWKVSTPGTLEHKLGAYETRVWGVTMGGRTEREVLSFSLFQATRVGHKPEQNEGRKSGLY